MAKCQSITAGSSGNFPLSQRYVLLVRASADIIQDIVRYNYIGPCKEMKFEQHYNMKDHNMLIHLASC